MNAKQRKPVNFEDLDDFDSIKVDETAPVEQSIDKWQQGSASTQGAIYEEKCDASGCYNGTFVSYSGRPVGPCFKCKGTGIRKFRTSPESRKAQRDYAAKQREEKARKAAEAKVAWREAHAEEVQFLEANASWSDFYRSLLDGLNQYGSLTEKQLVSVRNGIEKKRERDAAKAAEVQAAKASGEGLDLSELGAGYYAIPGGETRLKIRVTKPSGGTRWDGWIFVDDGAEYGHRQKYGSQRPGRLYEGKIQEQLRTILADPKAALAAYGHLVGRCGVCNRPLEDEESVARGIGPICWSKIGG